MTGCIFLSAIRQHHPEPSLERLSAITFAARQGHPPGRHQLPSSQHQGQPPGLHQLPVFAASRATTWAASAARFAASRASTWGIRYHRRQPQGLAHLVGIRISQRRSPARLHPHLVGISLARQELHRLGGHLAAMAACKSCIAWAVILGMAACIVRRHRLKASHASEPPYLGSFRIHGRLLQEPHAAVISRYGRCCKSCIVGSHRGSMAAAARAASLAVIASMAA